MLGMQAAQPLETAHNGYTPVSSPADFDRDLLFARPWEEIYAQWIHHGPRRTLAAMHSRKPAFVRDAIEAMGDASALARAVRLLALAELGDYAVVERDFEMPQGTDLDTLEATLYVLIAGSVAAAELGQPDTAVSRLHSASVMAHLLGMSHRQQWVELERQRMLLPLGLARPSAVRRALALAPTTAGRVAWGREIEGAALLSLGRYAEAGLVAGAGVRALALAMCGVHIKTESDSSYGSLALGVHALRQGRSPEEHLGQIQGQPEETYAELLQACHDLTHGRLPALPVLPRPLDQRLMWAMLAWESLLRGDTRQPVSLIITALQGALADMDMAPLEILTFIQPYAPVAVAALRDSPLAPSTDQMPPSPVLLGEHLSWMDQRIKLPGRSGGGSALLMRALGHDWPNTRMERMRVRRAIERLALPTPIVYITDLAKALAVLARGGGSAWRDCTVAVTFRVDSRAVKRELFALYGISPKSDV